MHVIVNMSPLPVYKKYSITSLLCIFETIIPTFPLKNILGFNNINKSTLGRIAGQIILAVNKIFKLTLTVGELFYA